MKFLEMESVEFSTEEIDDILEAFEMEAFEDKLMESMGIE